ncbi:XamI family restriction endonuclease [Burkholderia ubonensis]|uniref:XamI family restriction endonuclease n=1 Tax=Burkholderia ubonensis TaxID=101571 RepID=UPI0009B458E2|nr:XamI family restriction endonuclease [Burkholderia ubonensis]
MTSRRPAYLSEPVRPKIWDEAEIWKDAAKSKSELIARRNAQLQSELDMLADGYPGNMAAVDAALVCLETCIQKNFEPGFCREALGKLLSHDKGFMKRKALRYLAYPPISTDDLEAMAEIVSYTKKTVDAKLDRKNTDETPDPNAAKRVIEVINNCLDAVRFPWLVGLENRALTNSKKLNSARQFAVRSTALLMSSRQTEVQRRSNEKAELESQVRTVLDNLGFKKISRKALATGGDVYDAFERGQYMQECMVSTENADYLIRLWDGRFLFIECKASNSEINSRKRLNKEVVKVIQKWVSEVGASSLGSCAIRGIFKPEYVIQAQKQGVFIFWAHNLTPLEDFLVTAK